MFPKTVDSIFGVLIHVYLGTCSITGTSAVLYSRHLFLQTSEVRTVAAEGLAKLLLSGHVVSHKLLSRLLLLWYNPITEDDTHLRHCLGAFFPVYAFASRSVCLSDCKSFKLHI